MVEPAARVLRPQSLTHPERPDRSRRRPLRHIGRNGNLYPTHGLGPVAWYLGIHKGDRFDHMVSMSSPEAGLSAYRDAKLAPGDARRQEKYDCGDVNTSLLKTARGRTIVLQTTGTKLSTVDVAPLTRSKHSAATPGDEVIASSRIAGAATGARYLFCAVAKQGPSVEKALYSCQVTYNLADGTIAAAGAARIGAGGPITVP